MSGTKTEVIHFGIFRLDAAGQSLRRGEEEVPLRPKTWEVLRQLVGRPGQLITKDELIQRVWPGVAVTDGTLTQSIRELRAALQDDPKQPRFIATVHRRGYRFIATLEEEEQQAAAARPAQRTPLLVGRERELAALEGSLEAALRGRRGCVLVTGEAGVGKTSLIEAFLDAAARRHGDQLAVARGQCVEQRQDAEPYLPLLEALYQICRGRDGARFAELLRRFAPTWVVQIPWLLPPQELAALQQQLIGSGSERMLRELITALGEMASHAPLLIVLEDLHWSDLATLESIAALARRREPARLLLVGSMRAPAAASRAAAELRLALTTRSDASEIALDMLDAAAVRSYVRGRLGERTPEILLDAVVRHSGGSPLFLVTALTFASSQGWLSQTDGGCTLAITADELERALPVGLRQLIEAQVLGLAADDRELLQAASVAGIEVDAPILAVALGRSVDEMTAMLDQLSSRNRFLRRSATRQEPRPEPAAARFELTHALYHQVLYESLAPAKRRELHLAVGRALEVAYADRRSAVAADLARHYERGGAFLEAARYMGMAALNAHGRAADRESAALLEHALRLIGQLEDSPRRQRREADLCVQLGAVRGSIHGRGSEVYLEPFRRAWELAQELDDVPRMFIARMAAFGHFSLTEQLRQAEEVCRDLLALAARVPMPDLVAVANGAMGSVLFGRGRLAAAREHLELALATLNPHDPSTQLFRRLEDPEILCQTGLAWVTAQLGFADQARRRMAAAIDLGAARAPYHHVYCLNAAAILGLFLDDAESCADFAEQTLELARQQGFDGFLGNATVLACWAEERRTPSPDGWQRLQQEVEAYHRSPQRFGFVAYQAAVAEACLAADALGRGLEIIAAATALMESSGERAPESNVLRIKALLLAASGAAAGEVEACFAAALQAAQRAGARLPQLRAATALATWLGERNQPERARAVLEPIYAGFTEGHDTPPLQRAAALLAALPPPF